MRPRLLLALLAAALVLPAGARAADTPQTLSVVGHGTARAKPDVATIEVAVTRTLKEQAAASDSVNRRTRRVVASARALGVPATDIQTSSIRLTRHTLKPLHAGGPQRKRYTASITVTIRLTDLDLIGKVIDAARAMGANGISGPDFEFSTESVGLQQAEAAAIADARTRGDAAAAALGMQIVGVQSIVLEPATGPVLTAPQGSAVAAQPSAPKATAPTPVSTGTEEVSADVGVVFLIAPR